MISLKKSILFILLSSLNLSLSFGNGFNFPFQHNIACSLYSTCPQAKLLNHGSILISSARRLSPSGQIFILDDPNNKDSLQVEYKEDYIVCTPYISENIQLREMAEAPAINMYISEDLQTLNITMDKNTEGIQLLIFNIAGEMVNKQRMLKTTEIQIDISHLPKGMYFVKFLYKNEKVVKKFIKQ